MIEPAQSNIVSMSDSQRTRKHRRREFERAKKAREMPHCSTPELYKHLSPGIWSGHRAFIIGGGPSLRGFNWESLRGELTIGINRSIEYIEPSLFCAMDVSIWGKIVNGTLGEATRERFDNYDGMRVWWGGARWTLPTDEPNYAVAPGDPKHEVADTLREIYTHNNSGYFALQLALALGADPIYLLGFDMKGSNGRQSWFHSGYDITTSDGVYPTMIAGLTELSKDIKRKNRHVVNLSRPTNLNCFPHGDLEEATANQPTRPRVVSAYVESTVYERAAKRLAESLQLFSLTHELIPINYTSGYKPDLILRELRSNPRDLVWMNPTVRLIRYPTLFDDADFDIGFTKSRNIIYLTNNRRVHELVENWSQLLHREPSMDGFIRACHNNLRVKVIPDSYYEDDSNG